MWSAQAVRESKIDPKRVIVQWVGIGKHTHAHIFITAESNGKLPLLFIFSKTATLVPEFVVEDLPLGTTAALVPEFAVKDRPFGITLMMMI